MNSESSQSVPKTSIFRAFIIVAWSFFGVRRGADHKKDISLVTPLQIVIVGVVSGLLFVLTLIVAVNLIVS